MSGGTDDVGVFVPRWAMEDCGGDARDAMVWAQITWWLQPNQRNGQPRTRALVERDGHQWLYMTDERLGQEPGLSTDQVYRARNALKKRGLIDTQVRKVDGARVTLIRVMVNREPAVTETAKSRGGQTAKSRNSSNREPAVCTVTEDVSNQLSPTPSADKPAVAPAKATDDPLTKAAHRLAVLAFEQPVKPVLRSNGDSFSAVLSLLKSQLHAGRTVQAIERAIEAGVDVWTAAGLATSIARAKQAAGSRNGVVADLMEQIEQDRAKEQAG